MNRTMLRTLLVVTSLIALTLTAVPCFSQNSVIYACITKSAGQVRIVSTASQCKSNEASISWNIAGQQGPEGPQGPQGIQGEPGVPLGVCSDSSTKTYLLFPFVTNQAGFDTGISIANTGKDPSGNSGLDGTIVLSYYGASAPAADFTTPIVTQGNAYVNTASILAPSFQGYIIASCNFPFAHGFTFISDLGARNFATSYLATRICLPRIPPQ